MSLVVFYAIGGGIALLWTVVRHLPDAAPGGGRGRGERLGLVLIPGMLTGLFWPVYMSAWGVRSAWGWVTDRYEVVP